MALAASPVTQASAEPTTTTAAAKPPSHFSNLSMPRYTNSGDQNVTFSGHLSPGGNRPVSLYRISADGTGTYVAGTTSDSAGNFAITFRVDVVTRYRLYAGPTPNAQGVKSKDREVRSLRWWDTFDYTSKSQLLQRWTVRTGGDLAADRTRSYSTAQAVSVRNGEVVLKVLKPSPKAKPDLRDKWRLSQLTPAPGLPFVYGHLAARMKFQRPAGGHGALWWQTGETGEIDAVEFFGQRKRSTRQRVHHTIHRFGANTSKATSNVEIGARPDTWWSNYHTYEVFWGPQGYTFSIDGEVVARITDQGTASNPGQAIISMQSNDQEIPVLQKKLRTGEARLSDYKTTVQWVRVWR